MSLAHALRPIPGDERAECFGSAYFANFEGIATQSVCESCQEPRDERYPAAERPRLMEMLYEVRVNLWKGQ